MACAGWGEFGGGLMAEVGGPLGQEEEKPN